VCDPFVPFDVEEILKIKPGYRLQEDLVAWAPEPHGQYSVRSAYRLLKEEQMKEESQQNVSSGASLSNEWWKLLWKLKIPPKVRIF